MPSNDPTQKGSDYAPNALSHSRLSILQRCARRYYIEYERGMQRIGDDSKGLRMGAAMAHALELNNPKSAFKDVYESRLADARDQRTIDELMIESAFVEWYATKYIEIYGQCDVREFKYEFKLNDEFTFRGAVDGIKTCEDGKIRLVEDKFLGQWTEDDIEGLDLDPQITSEIFGVNSTGAIKQPVNEVLYRVTRKPRSIRRKGRGKDAKPESVAEFVSRSLEVVEENISEYFLEYNQPRYNDQLQDWYADTVAEAEKVAFLRTQARFPRAKKTCTYKGHCAHREICLGIKSAVNMYEKKEGYPT